MIKLIVFYVCKGNLVILEFIVFLCIVEDVMLFVLKEIGLELGSELFVFYLFECVILGKVFEELVNNDCIVGGINEEFSCLIVEFYKIFVKGNIYVMDVIIVEMVKVIENIYCDVNIVFVNELVKISEKIGVNVWEVIKLVNYYLCVNIYLLGFGVGGYCIVVDFWFLMEF